MSSGIQKAGLMTALQQFASGISTLKDEEVPEAYEVTAKLEGMFEEVRALLKQRAVDYLQANGRRATDKGTLEAEVNGFSLRAIPMRTGLDPKKLEATLRSKKLDPTANMNATIILKVDTAKVATLVGEGKLTKDDLAACAYDPSIRLEVKKLVDPP
jgi:hypothetical protein